MTHELTKERGSLVASLGGDADPDNVADLAEARKNRELGKVTKETQFTDAGLAVKATDEVLQGRFLMAFGEERAVGWMQWTGTVWEPCGDEPPRDALKEWFLAESQRAAAKGDDSATIAWAKCCSAAKIKSVLLLARGVAELGVKVGDLDADPYLLNTPSGVVDLRTGELRPHDPALLQTKITSGSYRLNDDGTPYTHPDIELALTALDPPEAEWLRRRVGQATTGEVPPDDVVMVWQGDGSNGKSAFASWGLVPAMGNYWKQMSHKMFSSANEHSTEIADFQGVRGAIGEEMTEQHALNVTFIKRIVGQPEITARRMYKDNVTFRATHTVIINTNPYPAVTETDHGTWRRFALLRFPYTYVDSPAQVVSDRHRVKDLGLRQRIADNADGQHDAFVTWAVRGAMQYLADPVTSLKPTVKVRHDTDAWRTMNDQVFRFWNERLIADPDAMVLSRELVGEYNAMIGGKSRANAVSDATFTKKFEVHAKTLDNEVEKKRTRDLEGLSRPRPRAGDPDPEPVTKQSMVWTGVRFLNEWNTADVEGADA